MQTHFPYLKDFFKNSNSKSCPFCGNKLKNILTNFIGVKSSGHSLLNSRPKNNCLQFFIRYESFNEDMVEVNINIDNNLLDIKMNSDRYSTKLILESIRKMSPHLESYCSNRQCKFQHKYYISTEVLSFETENDKKIKVKPVNLYMEAFNLKNLWVQNDWSSNELSIFNKDNLETPPIKHKILDLESLGKDKIINKILMMAVFS